MLSFLPWLHPAATSLRASQWQVVIRRIAPGKLHSLMQVAAGLASIPKVKDAHSACEGLWRDSCGGGGAGVQTWLPLRTPSLSLLQTRERLCKTFCFLCHGTSWARVGMIPTLSPRDGGAKHLSWIFRCPRACFYMIIGLFGVFFFSQVQRIEEVTK